ncbi:MAG TPA: cysteine desulfurase family protein [Candidatus Limnocylindrales bacterium]|nr:cysteine desulfurase family protein [Candidatus Limnocylindrales bacterium]
MSKSIRMVYLDHSASTPLDPVAAEAMRPYLDEWYGNGSSAHAQGRAAEAAIEDARERVARLLNCRPGEIVFTGGGTESDNLALRGAAQAQRQRTGALRIVTSHVEHSAVSKTAAQLAQCQGFEARFAGVDSFGRALTEDLEAAATGAALVSLMLANNEVGTLHDLTPLASLAHAHGVLFHTDAVQAGGQIALDVQALGVDLLSLSAHKFYGPKGVGLLFVREGTPLIPAQTGGSHENGLRAGTPNTPGIVGMAVALERAMADLPARAVRFAALRDQIMHGISTTVAGAQLTGHPTERLPGHASFVFDGVDGNLLLMHLDARGVMASSGSACKTGNPEPSEVLLALGYPRALALAGLRLTVGLSTTEDDIDYAIGAVAESVAAVRRFQSTHA